MVEHHLKENGITVYTQETARKFEGDDQGKICKVITDKREIETDLVIMAVGVRPRSELAKDAGLLVSSQGGIVVNQRMQTSDPNIYAAGDCVETNNLISGKKAYAPMGSIANRQGRVVADNLAGIPSTFNGVIGSFIMKVFDLSVGSAGLSLDVAKAEGYDAVGALCAQYDRAHFFPNKKNMFLHMVVDRSDKRVLGLQGIGALGDGLMARINAVAGLLERKAVISDLSNLELPYAPPFSTAIDILNATANVSDNVVSGRVRSIDIEEFISWMDGNETHPDWLVIDLRHPADAARFIEKFPDRWQLMLYDKFREEYEQLPKDKMLILTCNAGAKAYEVQCFLDSVDIKKTVVLPGGLNVIRNLGVDWWPS
jgi:rhodanese-related sulfurtransferase